MIGDGRFYGLGLVQPVATHSDVVAFNLDPKQRVTLEDGPALIRHLRRALMALARDHSGAIGVCSTRRCDSSVSCGPVVWAGST